MTPVEEIDALVLINAVLIMVTCHEDEVELMSESVTIGAVDSILTPGVVTLTIMSMRLLPSLISSIVSLESTKKDNVRPPAF